MKRRTLLASLLATMFAPTVAKATPARKFGKWLTEYTVTANFGEQTFVYGLPRHGMSYTRDDMIGFELDLRRPVTYTKSAPLNGNAQGAQFNEI